MKRFASQGMILIDHNLIFLHFVNTDIPFVARRISADQHSTRLTGIFRYEIDGNLYECVWIYRTITLLCRQGNSFLLSAFQSV